MLSVMIFKETVNTAKVVGLAIVIAGVAVLGLGGRK
jgi:multidrug transporter EmrE-like cation transporter